MNKQLYLSGILLSFTFCAFSQKADSVIDRIAQFPNSLFNKIKNKTAHLDGALTRQTEKYLTHLAKKERKLQHKLSKKDSTAARNLFAGSQEKYLYLEQQIKAVNRKSRPLSGEYLPYIDSLKNSLSFLQQNQKFLNAGPELQNKITGSLTGFNQLESRFEVSEQVKEFIQQRKQQLRNAFSHYTNSLGVSKYLDQYNKEAYYYAQQVKEYKELLNDPEKLEKKALGLLNQLPAFQQFMKKNSMLASLFNLPGTADPTQIVQGLPSRDQVMSALQGQLGSSISNPASMIQQNLQSAQGQIDQLRDKLNSGGNGDINMHDFKPNNQKTKSFPKRLEIGINLQTTHSNFYFPITTDIGFSLGYKLSDKATAGIGSSYKLGWGSGFNHVSVSSQGVALRSFLDMKIKGNFYISGGYEENYQQPFSNFQQLIHLSTWQESGLVGMSKMVSLPGKLVKKTKLQLLWDFLSYSQIPRTEAMKFRVGYSF